MWTAALHSCCFVPAQAAFQPPVDNSRKPFPHWAHGRPKRGGGSADAAVHPYIEELAALRYPDWQLEAPQPQPAKSLELTPLHWVDTAEGLQAMVEQLQGCRHLALDLENHSFRSFQGFTCLMQVSSRDADWVVDCLALRAHLGPALQPLLADPGIVKVLHGADRDVVWLQRDFHLYLVNMFDTGQAARVLALPSFGLAHLLNHFCCVTADKRWQLADWRVRPLSPPMLHYARCDTHYLLYIYDRLKQMLLEEGRQPPTPLALVLERSRRLTLVLYQKEEWSPVAYQDMLVRWEVSLLLPQRVVLAGLLAWRDDVCRTLDESGGYVLPKAQLLLLAKNMPGNGADLAP
ncbi:ribonuclease H-like domain-containing protein [Haematococcus lacustris]